MEITDDVISENLENLFLNLTARSGEVLERVNVNTTRAEVKINDNDRESIQHTINHVLPYNIPHCTIRMWFADERRVRIIYSHLMLGRSLVQYQ